MMAAENLCGIAPLAAVLRLAQQYPVFPCRRHAETVTINGRQINLKPKSPLTTRGFLDATQDEAQVRTWWGRWPEALVGVPTGVGTGLVVVDYDHGKVDQAAQEWIGEHSNDLLSTRTHSTFSGGKHYLYRNPDGRKYRSSVSLTLGGIKRQGIDSRAEGGYVVWWPLHGGDRSGIVAPLPAGLIDEYLIEDRPPTPLPTTSPDKWARDRGRVLSALAYVDPTEYPVWQRIGAAIHLASGGSDDGFEMWHAWSSGGVTGETPRNYAGVDDCRVRWASFHHTNNRISTLGTVFHHAEQGGWKTPTDPPDDGRFASIDEIAKDGVVDPEEIEADAALPLFVTADSLRAQKFDSPPPIIDDLLLVGATLVHGPAKKGKSWLLLQMATTIDAGGEFLHRKCRRADVLYVGAEDTSARFKSRLERMAAWGTCKFMNRDALMVFAKRLQRAMGEGKVTAQVAVEKLWEAAGKPSVMFLDTQEVFEVITGIAHGKQGDSITRRDYQATSSYDAIAQKLGIAVVLVGHWGEIKNIEKATTNPHECLNTTKARLAGVLTSVTLGPLPNQEPGESTRDMQLSIRSRDIAEGDQFLWVQQSEMTGLYRSLGKVRDVLLTEAQGQLFGALIDAHKAHGEHHWTTAKDLADQLDCSAQAIKQMVGRVRRSAKARNRTARVGLYELESKTGFGYRVKVCEQEET